MKTAELLRLRAFLFRVGPPVNPFRDEVLAYVVRDLAIREQQRKDMREMNRDQQADCDWPFYG